MYRKKLSAGLTQISAAGGKRVHIHCCLLLNFAKESSASGPQSGKAPLFFIFISLHTRTQPDNDRFLLLTGTLFDDGF